MRNKFPGICYRCGEPVEPYGGHFERDRVARIWRTQHADCAIAYRGTEVGNTEPRGPRGGHSEDTHHG
jgi:hypothetical protein